jgi:hypothetical protein
MLAAVCRTSLASPDMQDFALNCVFRPMHWLSPVVSDKFNKARLWELILSQPKKASSCNDFECFSKYEGMRPVRRQGEIGGKEDQEGSVG